ncbi:MAG TPA: translation initiation factor IF-1 [Candidatus Pacebacteria bacterium]|nr:translation initiation factor IF-1 [Candidatus Paceibacterota bacterium]HIP33596.1 translation initiation factor IF-1 [Bacteroidia bacterium]
MAKVDGEIEKAVVVESLPNSMFRVRFDDGEEEIAYLAGKMKIHRIRVLIGDTVEIMIDPYGGKGRIVKRTINR